MYGRTVHNIIKCNVFLRYTRSSSSFYVTNLDVSEDTHDNENNGDGEEQHGALPLTVDEALGEDPVDRDQETSQA